MKWENIETAPKDGTELLLVVAGFVPSTGRFDVEIGQWMTVSCEDFEDDDSWANYVVSCVASCSYSPTHWMPLPESPKAG